MDKGVYFISDIHLGLQDETKERLKEAALVSFLHFIEDKAEALYIVGDMFDYWFEYRRVIQKGYFKVFTALANLVEKGVEVHYIIGNHDFMHRDFFTKQIGVHVYEEPIDVIVQGKRFFIAHGDGLVANDLGYKILKKILRNKKIQWIYSLFHPDLGIAIASHSSKTSRQYTAQKDYGEQDSMFATASGIIDNGFDYVVFGHSHAMALKPYGKGVYVNLGSWLFQPVYGVYSGGMFHIEKWNYND
ncbi:MAG: UDP-2,3-diacylglucosamine diphosphatase [Ignavibacteria bacterium]|nr:UDP-2,3-diacylglucosamine diphosphatase [Ignavibacteria bacterium]